MAECVGLIIGDIEVVFDETGSFCFMKKKIKEIYFLIISGEKINKMFSMRKEIEDNLQNINKKIYA